jgi:glycosyltransferase involved in cell wall biosynthesis
MNPRTDTAPPVTVLMPVYNGEAFLSQALESVLRQSFQDFELLVIDDGSTDATAAILEACSDRRLRIVRNPRNLGLVATLNKGLDLARGELVARMDQDDIASPARLESQVQFLSRHPQIGVCGTWFHALSGGRCTLVQTPCTHEDLSAHLFFSSPFAHPSVMLRKAMLDRNGLRYDPAAKDAEDFDLWVRCRSHTRFATLPRALLKYRIHDRQVSSISNANQAKAADSVRAAQLGMLVQAPTEPALTFHLQVCRSSIEPEPSALREARDWLDTLAEANRQTEVFDDVSFGKALHLVWYRLCAKLSPNSLLTIPIYLSRQYGGLSSRTMRGLLRVVANGLLGRSGRE